MKYTLSYAETNSPTLSMYSQVSSIYKWEGGSWGGGGVRGEVGLAQKTQNGKPKFINLLLP